MTDIICNTVASTLDEMELHYKNEGQLFVLTVGDEYADFPIRIIADEEKEILTTIGYFPVKISKTYLDKMYKFINDLNYKTIAGSFTIDSDDGELSFRLANNVDDGAINEGIVKSCFLQVMMRLRNTYEDIMKAMYGGEQYTFTFGDDNKQLYYILNIIMLNELLFLKIYL